MKEHRLCGPCIHAITVDGSRYCREQLPAVPVEIARAFGGECGPEAKNMNFPGLYLHPRPLASCQRPS